jgi:hypothetical protein
LQKSSIYPGRTSADDKRYALSLLALLLFVAASCRSSAPEATSSEPLCLEDGRLSAELYGGVQIALDWRGEQLECEGMPRPNNEGARLRFAGPAQSGSARRSLAFILAMPDLAKGATGKELPTNVTMIDEHNGRFFGTQDTDNCWTDVEVHEQINGLDEAHYRVSGVLYCLAPLAELNGRSSVTLAEMAFTGRLNWEIPQ